MAERICSIEDCGRAGKLTRGMCNRCYRYWIDHTPKGERDVAPRFVDDFMQQVRKTHEHGCWLWRGRCDRKGYGLWRSHLAHRESWRRERGPIDGGLLVLHICDQHACVNPTHLYLGTTRENAIDASVRGRLASPRKERCPKGHAKDGDNLVVAQSGGYKSYRCRQCENERSNERQKEARRVRGLTRPRLSLEDKQQIQALRRSGASHRKIAASVGRSLVSVQKVLKEAGL